MTYRTVLTALVAGLMATAAWADQVRLPPSVGATPIEIPGAAIVGGIGTGRTSATPIEIPGAARPNPQLSGVQPLPMPGASLTQLDPRANPGRFSVLPVPLPRVTSTGKIGRFTYAILPDGTIYGDTNFGYTRFSNMNVYQDFLRQR
ncbi:hypothetical protein RXV86_19345 [Alisedimentitalea sp. MJ-SS2]|uniref:hypothetical protein n=1 Tax=Aliisedimentitalea sp. MJ-SS2 TaxID=3049795 RepID=UPI00290B6715|nr:hypothetical protein [Alisedimentitalea sp. MJ-SS2]MDU8929551.1 hypothetical protein [Alisedimentitalea sp. MJ-SS2]